MAFSLCPLHQLLMIRWHQQILIVSFSCNLKTYHNVFYWKTLQSVTDCNWKPTRRFCTQNWTCRLSTPSSLGSRIEILLRPLYWCYTPTSFHTSQLSPYYPVTLFIHTVSLLRFLHNTFSAVFSSAFACRFNSSAIWIFNSNSGANRPPISAAWELWVTLYNVIAFLFSFS